MKKILLLVALFLLIFVLVILFKISFSDNNFLESISSQLAENYNGGDGVRIAVIDSGVSEDNKDSKYTLNFSSEDNTIDNIDHGVPIVNILFDENYGLAPNATVYSLKVINQYGNASTKSIFNALEWCLNNSIDIINISLSSGVFSENIECILSELIENGVIIVSSINNENKYTDYPSMYDGVIAVGKTDNPDLYEKDNCIIFSKAHTVRIVGKEGVYKDYAGNSFLAPIVTGIIACLIDTTKQEGGYTNEELIICAKTILNQNGLDIK